MRSKLFAILSIILVFIAIISIMSFGIFLLKKYSENELDKLSKSLQISGYLFTASLGSLALLKYWDSVADKKEATYWNKYQTLNKLYNEFTRQNANMIITFEWPHKFQKIEELCKKDDEYDITNVNVTDDEIKTFKELDNFLDFFENLYYSIEKKIITYDDIKVFFHYYINLLAEVLNNEDNVYFNKYVDNYFFNIRSLVDEYTSKFPIQKSY